jgi:hypothetical protein
MATSHGVNFGLGRTEFQISDISDFRFEKRNPTKFAIKFAVKFLVRRELADGFEFAGEVAGIAPGDGFEAEIEDAV